MFSLLKTDVSMQAIISQEFFFSNEFLADFSQFLFPIGGSDKSVGIGDSTQNAETGIHIHW